MAGQQDIPTQWEAVCLWFIRNGAHAITWSVMTAHAWPISPRLSRKGWAEDTGHRLKTRDGREVMALTITKAGLKALARYQRSRESRAS